MLAIHNVSVVGANGAMGSGCGGLIASFGEARVFMIARTREKAMRGIDAAVASVRSEVIRERLVPLTYDELHKCIPESDWVFETVAESETIKTEMNTLISAYAPENAILSTNTSGIPIRKLSCSFTPGQRARYMGTHFFNPPYRMPLCELIAHRDTDPSILHEFREYLENVLYRKVVATADTPAFAANRIGFHFLNRAVQWAESSDHPNPVGYVDQILGGFTGRALPPAATIDFVGLDVHAAIVDNLYTHTEGEEKEAFRVPVYVRNLIRRGALGRKSGQGLYKNDFDKNGTKIRQVYVPKEDTYVALPECRSDFVSRMRNAISVSDYRAAADILRKYDSEDAAICRAFTAQYISYAFSIIHEVVESRDDCDITMAMGFNWVPPSYLVHILGGARRCRAFLRSQNVMVPPALAQQDELSLFYHMSRYGDARKYFRAY